MSAKPSSSSALVCLTGGIATGKSRAGDWFAAHGWSVICTDQIVHQLYAAGQSLPKEIAVEFGTDILAPNGSVHRAKLGKIVFQDPLALQKLNALVHPKVREAWLMASKVSLAKGLPTMVIIPLAYETGAEKEFKQMWVVACSPAEQRRRLAGRGLSKVQIEQRLGAQWPIQKKIDQADRVVWNNADWSLTKVQLAQLVQEAA